MTFSLFNSSKSHVYTYRHKVADAHGNFKVDTYANAAAHANTKDTDALLVHFVPGAFATRQTTKRMAQSAIRQATAEGRAAKVVVPRVPWKANAYRPAVAMGRDARAVLDTAQRHPGEAMHVVGHSWSWGNVVKIALRLREEARIASVTGYTPTSHPPQPNHRNVLDLPGAVVEEIIRLPRVFPRLGSVAIAASLGLSIAGRFLQAPATVVRRTYNTLREDVTPDVAALHRTPVEITALLADNDEVFSPDVTHERLIEAGLPEGTIGTVHHMTHLSAVTDYRHGAHVYEAIAHHPVHTAGMAANSLRPELALAA